MPKSHRWRDNPDEYFIDGTSEKENADLDGVPVVVLHEEWYCTRRGCQDIKERRKFFMLSDFEEELGKDIDVSFIHDLMSNAEMVDFEHVTTHHPEEGEISRVTPSEEKEDEPEMCDGK